MKARLVQLGAGNVRDAYIIYHLTAELDKVVTAAVGPDALVLNLTGASMSGAYNAVFPFKVLLGPYLKGCTLGKVVLVGFSEGCQAVRAHLKLRDLPDGVIAADGTHASWPMDEASLQPWREAFQRALNGDAMFYASHSGLTYVEHLKAPHRPYASTFSVLKEITGWPLEIPPSLDPVFTSTDDAAQRAMIWSCGGTDAAAHVHQAKVILPMMLKRMRNILRKSADTSVTAPAVEYPDHYTLGERCVEYCRKALGVVKEEPAGSNSGPIIRALLAPCIRKDTGDTLGLTKGNWCAAFQSAALYACSDPGEVKPHGYRAAVTELVADAVETNTWRPVGLCRVGNWMPQVGDLAIYDRSVMGKPETSWYRHVARVCEVGEETFVTIGGNEEDTVKETKRRFDDERLLGFIEYPRQNPPAGKMFTESERREIMAQVALSLDSLAREQFSR